MCLYDLIMVMDWAYRRLFTRTGGGHFEFMAGYVGVYIYVMGRNSDRFKFIKIFPAPPFFLFSFFFWIGGWLPISGQLLIIC